MDTTCILISIDLIHFKISNLYYCRVQFTDAFNLVILNWNLNGT